MKKNKKSLDFTKKTIYIYKHPNLTKEKNMMNVQMILTALEHYGSYMYYAYNSDSLRPQDAKNFCEFIEKAQQTLIFTDPDNEETIKDAQFVSKLLGDASTYAHRLKHVLCRAKTYEQAKMVYDLLANIADITFVPNFYTETKEK